MLNRFLSNQIYVMASAIFAVALTAVVAIQNVSIADEPYSLYPCNGKSGRFTPCGGNGPPAPGNCTIFVGAPSTCTDDCTDAHGYMCRTDDACINKSTDIDSFCETANYPGTTYK